MTTNRDDPDILLAALAARSLQELPKLADDLVDHMWEQVYDPAGPVPKDDFWRSCQDNIGNILTTLRRAGPSTGALMGSARETGNRRARQHCPLEWVLQSWQVGGEILWRDLAGRAGTEDVTEFHDLVRYASDVWGIANRFSVEMAASYQRVEHHLLAGTDHHLVDILDTLLDGRAGDLDSDATRALHLQTRERFIIGVAEDAPRYHGSARALAQALEHHGLFSAWHLRAGSHVGLIPAVDTTPEQVATILRLPAAARIGLSPVLTDLHQAPTGHRMATLAMNTLPHGQEAAATLDECLPEALLLNSPELSQRLITSTLGPIIALPTHEQDELLRTIHAWVDSRGSSLKAAKILYCHRNTVLNRLSRIHALTGFDPTDAATWPRIMLGLTALESHRW